jgi:hypothetical protein
MTFTLILRIMAASLESLAEIAEKATPEQMQAILERHNKRMDRCEALLDRLRFWEKDEEQT